MATTLEAGSAAAIAAATHTVYLVPTLADRRRKERIRRRSHRQGAGASFYCPVCYHMIHSFLPASIPHPSGAILSDLGRDSSPRT